MVVGVCHTSLPAIRTCQQCMWPQAYDWITILWLLSVHIHLISSFNSNTNQRCKRSDRHRVENPNRVFTGCHWWAMVNAAAIHTHLTLRTQCIASFIRSFIIDYKIHVCDVTTLEHIIHRHNCMRVCCGAVYVCVGFHLQLCVVHGEWQCQWQVVKLCYGKDISQTNQKADGKKIV